MPPKTLSRFINQGHEVEIHKDPGLNPDLHGLHSDADVEDCDVPPPSSNSLQRTFSFEF